MNKEYGMDWEKDMSRDDKLYLLSIGGFEPGCVVENVELRGVVCDESPTVVYFNSDEIRCIANAMINAAQWLEKRAELKMIQDQENKED